MNEKISIIIPCYNAGKTLNRTLNSVREQDYKNLEIILVNDGSTDNTLEVANKYASIDPRIVVINQENAGVSVARNNGLSCASGKYIVWLDADDNYTTPYAISNMYKKLVETGADQCICNFTHPCFEQYLPSGVYDLTDDEQRLTLFQDFFAFGISWNKITKRECLTENFIPGVKFAEDGLYNLDNFHNLKKVVIIDEVYYNYYCAPYNPKEQASAINSIYTMDKFWEKKCTIWHLGRNNQEYREKSIKKFFPSLYNEMKFVRSFDFFFWDFFMLAKNRVREDYVEATIKGIFEEPFFIDTIKDKERFGLTLKEITSDMIEEFTHLAYHAFIDIKSYNKKLSMFKVFVSLFGKIFFDIRFVGNRRDILLDSMVRLNENSSAEAIYVNSILNIQKLQAMEKSSLIVFDNCMANWCMATI